MNNKLIIGDNLIYLKTLADNSIDCVYTDPPYNTNNTKLTYKDNTNDQDWLDFMEPRIKECHRVMKKEATILIHIDENMITELSTIMHKVFGKKNKITTFVWKQRSSGSAQSKFCTQEHEYILAYAKDIKKAKWYGIPQFEEKDKIYPHQEKHYPIYHGDDENDILTELKITGKPNDIRPNQNYPIHINKTKISLTPFPGSIEVKPMNGKEIGCWRCIPATCQKLIDADMLIVKNNKLYQKQYAHFQFDKKTGKLYPFVRTTPVRTILQGDKYPTNLHSNKEIKEIFGKSAFTYAKPLLLVKNLLKVVSKEGDTVLDIFAGSGTTGQACHELNRNFILCQINEAGIPELIKERLNKTIGKDNYEISEE